MEILLVFNIMLFPEILLVVSLTISLTGGNLMRPPSSKVFFQWGLSERADLDTFFNSKARAVREVVFKELAPPHRLVMGHDNGT